MNKTTGKSALSRGHSLPLRIQALLYLSFPGLCQPSAAFNCEAAPIGNVRLREVVLAWAWMMSAYEEPAHDT